VGDRFKRAHQSRHLRFYRGKGGPSFWASPARIIEPTDLTSYPIVVAWVPWMRRTFSMCVHQFQMDESDSQGQRCAW